MNLTILLYSNCDKATIWSAALGTLVKQVLRLVSFRLLRREIWRAFGLKPWQEESFKISPDPELIEKTRDIVGLYLDPPEASAVFAVDGAGDETARGVAHRWKQRLSVVRGFAEHLSAFDSATQVPPLDLLAYRRRRPTPYLFSDAGVNRLVAATSPLNHPLRVATHRTLFGLLATTGMRVSVKRCASTAAGVSDPLCKRGGLA